MGTDWNLLVSDAKFLLKVLILTICLGVCEQVESNLCFKEVECVIFQKHLIYFYQ